MEINDTKKCAWCARTFRCKVVNTWKHEAAGNVLDFDELSSKIQMACPENNGSGCIPASFPFLRGHKEICSVSLTQLMHVFTSDYFSKIIHLSLSAASQTQMSIVRRRPELQMFTGGDGGISGGEGAFNNEGPENLLPGSPRAEEWAASRERERQREKERESFMQ